MVKKSNSKSKKPTETSKAKIENPMMTMERAYKLATSAVMFIATDVKTTITPSRSKHNKKTIEEYRKPNRIDADWWIHVSFFPENDKQAELIYKKVKELSSVGISFDTGGCAGQRDWELDWSFKLNDKQDTVHAAALETVEKLYALTIPAVKSE